ncbi:MAG: TolC family protein [Flavitalea sp.]
MSKQFRCLIFLVLYHALSFAQDNTVDYFVKQALLNSPLLQDYQNQTLSNSIDSQKIRAALLPQVNAVTNSVYAPVFGNVGYDGAITNGANISSVVGVNKRFIGKKNLQYQFQTIDLSTKAIQNTAAISRQELIKTVTAQYITTYGDLEQYRFSKDIQQLLNKEDTILKKLTQSNVYKQTDYLTFLVTLQQQRIATSQAEILFNKDLYALNYLCGITDTQVIELQKPDIVLVRLPNAEQSIFYRKFLLDSLALRNQKITLDFIYKPRLNIFADAGYVSSLLSLPLRNFGTSFGFNLTVPIYDGHQRKLEYRRLDIAQQTNTNYQQFFSRQYRQQISMLGIQLHSTQELIGQINTQIKYAEGLIEVNNKLLVTGDVRIADLVIALNNYLNAKNLLTQSTVNNLQLINELNYWNR